MQTTKRILPPFCYFTLVSSLTSLVFLLCGILMLALFSVKFSSSTIQIIILLLLWKGALVGLFSWFAHKKAGHKDFLVKFIGIYLGRFFGIMIGGFLGYEIAHLLKQPNYLGFVIGVLAFYFMGRWIGPRISAFTAAQLDNVFSLPEPQAAVNVANIILTGRLAALGLIVYGVIAPFLLVTTGLLLKFSDVAIDYFPGWLLVSRLVVVGYSIYSIGAPWRL